MYHILMFIAPLSIFERVGYAHCYWSCCSLSLLVAPCLSFSVSIACMYLTLLFIARFPFAANVPNMYATFFLLAFLLCQSSLHVPYLLVYCSFPPLSIFPTCTISCCSSLDSFAFFSVRISYMYIILLFIA